MFTCSLVNSCDLIDFSKTLESREFAQVHPVTHEELTHEHVEEQQHQQHIPNQKSSERQRKRQEYLSKLLSKMLGKSRCPISRLSEAVSSTVKARDRTHYRELLHSLHGTQSNQMAVTPQQLFMALLHVVHNSNTKETPDCMKLVDTGGHDIDIVNNRHQ